MPRTPAALALALAACSLRPYDFDATATATDPTSTTGGPTTGSSGSTAPVTTTATTSADTTGLASSSTTPSPFIVESDGGLGGSECDVLAQDCPEGQKCMPYSGDGDNAWESYGCFPLVPDPADLYQPCKVLGNGVDGLDTCDAHLMCWNFDSDTGEGVCYGLCIGDSWDKPMCADPNAYCLGNRSGLPLCIPNCDPIAQDCHGSDLCLPHPQDPNSFICILDASGDEGQAFDPCEYINACDPGLLCADPTLANECDPMADGCCLPFCDLTVMPPPCPGEGQQCLPWFDDDPAPPGLENVGICGLPQ